MHATVRQYAEINPATFDRLLSRHADVEALITQIPGFVTYDLVRTKDGMTSVTVCTGQAGTETSTRQVGVWIAKNLQVLSATIPTITAG